MKKALIIVESPAKIKTLKKFLGNDYLFASSVGHIRDLPKKEFGIEVEKDFDPNYVNLPDKKDVILNLKKLSKQVEIVYLSPDPDREGEAIAWHIASILPKNTKFKRVTFNSITKTAVVEGLKKPRDINEALVNAQQARRLLDRIVGYKVSPILSRKIKKGKSHISAGRVQSVALKLVIDREKAINSFASIEYWNIYAFLNVKNNESIETYLYSIDGEKISKEEIEGNCLLSNQQKVDEIVEKLKKSTFIVDKISEKEKKRNPVPPFITSTLQQEASRHFGFSVSRSMKIAQMLYEGIDMGKHGEEGVITYMRTDSVQVSQEALSDVRAFISGKYDKKNLPDKPNLYHSKKSAQEAHEAIRPTDVYKTPDSIKEHLTEDQYKIYSLIWTRFVASQMKEAVYDVVTLIIKTNTNMILRSSFSKLKFKGFLSVYEEKKDADNEEEIKENKFPILKSNDELKLKEIKPVQSFTKPPPRFTEASLVKQLEKSGVGRPSTYATIMNKIQNREYTIKEKQTLIPTELGFVIVQMLESNFAPIMNIGFTVAMEDDLELIAENKRNWKEVVKEFYTAFIPMVEEAKEKAFVPKIDTNISCPKCGSFLQKIWYKSKYFYGCSKYPDCPYTSDVNLYDFQKDKYEDDFEWNQPCSKCFSSMIVRHGRYGAFLGCSQYPKCKGIINIPKKGEAFLKPEDRPDCPAIGCDGKIMMRKSRFGKTFYSCDNFPECDVIVNDLNDLNEKYIDHAKTPYQKKSRYAKKTTKAKAPIKKKTTAVKKVTKKASVKKKEAAKPKKKTVTVKKVAKKSSAKKK